MSRPKSRRDEGSIFIETMIAAAVVAVMLGGLYQAVGASAQRHRMVEARRDALMIAQSRLAAVGAEIPLQAGSASGLEGPYVWQVEVSPQPSGRAESDAGRLALVSVTVRERSGGELARLRTLRLARAG